MTMSSTLIESIKRRASDEAERTSYPEGFPVLPPVPASRYSDPDFAALETNAVFGKSWLMVAHVDELPDAGSYRRLDQVLRPVMLVRADDGSVKAFYNTCKHRGSALVLDESGNTGKRLTCPYHNWVYSLTGELVGYPEQNNFGDLDRDCLALTSIRCETWGPLVFINFDPDAEPLIDYLGQVATDLSELGEMEGKLHLLSHRQRSVPVNWKIPVDANIETYHVNYVHKDTAATGLRQATTGIQLLPNGHSRMLIGLQDGLDFPSPFPELFGGVGDLPSSGTFSYHVFPNLSIVFAGPGFMLLITNWPAGSPGESTYHVHYCASLPPDDPEQGELLQVFAGLNETVLFEDLTVLPGIQESIDAGSLTGVQLQYQERRIYALHETIDRVVGPDRIPETLRVPQILGEHVEV
jgi:phenylpropionate dioxygenase-like ring-hydroxylating dioxygenase large terminal subunit